MMIIVVIVDMMHGNLLVVDMMHWHRDLLVMNVMDRNLLIDGHRDVLHHGHMDFLDVMMMDGMHLVGHVDCVVLAGD